ncbi:ABC transporter substrate-binding protein [Halococcus sp. IIIV-5B]|uniref:ABC transporter substrate-binding protein n=1 Tax=Halococcus sp. IIIV-5B TaxID=2321230 RepID=UPI000E716C78|nr:ABC transporter substrate-binding protein [Halococcus sp. IIIV-5B]RJT07169.1 hypothetical protein D3261_03970 [Halococcus sp. IIIV-5B]
MQFNPYNPNNQFVADFYHPLADFNLATQQFEPLVASDWTIDGGSMTLNLAPDLTWDNGDEFIGTDMDIWLTFQQYVTQGTVMDFIDDWTIQDDKTIQLALSNPNINNSIIEYNILGELPDTPRALWRDHAKRLKDTEGGEDVVSEIVQRQITDVNNAVTNSVWSFTGFDGLNRAQYNRRDGGNPDLSNVEIPSFGYQVTTSRQQRLQALRGNEIDWQGQLALSEPQRESLPDHLQYVYLPTDNFIHGSIVFNQEHDLWGQRAVRKAAAFYINIAQTAANQSWAAPGTRLNGMEGNKVIQDEWINDILGNFTDYDADNRVERGDAVLRDAGFSKQNGVWISSDGQSLSGDIISVSDWRDATVATQSVVDMLNSHGFDMQQTNINSTQYFDQVFSEQGGDFEAAWAVMGAEWPQYPHPLSVYSWVFGDSGPSQWFLRSQNEYDVPMPIGNPNGSTESINVQQLVSDLRTASNDQAATEIVDRLAWTFNQTVPAVITNPAGLNRWFNTTDFNIPSVDDPFNPSDKYLSTMGIVTRMIREGFITPK